MEFPHLDRLLKEASGRLEILAVNTGDSPGKIRSLMEKERHAFRALLPKEGEARPQDLYRVIAKPANYLIGPDGKILDATVGFPVRGLAGEERPATDAEVDSLPFYKAVRKALAEIPSPPGR